MKHKVWEFNKEDLERLASRIMNQTLKALVKQRYMYQVDANEFIQSNIPVAITPDSLDNEIASSIFKNENLNAKCLYKIIKIE